MIGGKNSLSQAQISAKPYAYSFEANENV